MIAFKVIYLDNILNVDYLNVFIVFVRSSLLLPW